MSQFLRPTSSACQPGAARLLKRAAFLWLGTVHLACSTPAPSPAPRSPVETLSQDRLEVLRSLGYPGTIPASDDRAGDGLAASEASAAKGFRFLTAPTICTAALVDAEGRLRATWRGTPCDRWAHAELLPDGDLLVVGTDPGGEDPEALTARRFMMRVSWRGEVLWKRPFPAHHDARLLSSGRILALSAVHLHGPSSDGHPWRDNRVTLLDNLGHEIESRSLWEAFRQPGAPRLLDATAGPRGDIDLFHANAAQWVNPQAVLVTIRHQDLVVLLDWKSGRIRWSWGRGELDGPHDAAMLENGHVLIFDNGLARGWSRLLEVSPATGQVVWSYQTADRSRFFSLSRGSVQRLSNGNTLVAESDRGRVFEVTPAGRVVWDYLCPLRDVQGRRATIMRARLHDEAWVASLLATGDGPRDVRSEPLH